MVPLKDQKCIIARAIVDTIKRDSLNPFKNIIAFTAIITLKTCHHKRHAFT